FSDNPEEDNQTTVERFVEESCQCSRTPVVSKKKKAKKLVFPGPTIQDSEKEVPNTPSNQMEMDSEEELIPQKGKRKGKIPSGTESTQGSAISQRQVPEMPIISEPELELIQTVLHGVKGKGLGSIATNPPRSDELLEHPQKVPQRGGNSEILQWMKSTIIQTTNQKDQGIPCQEEGGNQGRSPSSFYKQAPNQPTSPRREEEQEKELERTIFPNLQDSKNPKRCLGQCL
ncbi:hypothetical protein O181_102346, partial [Austropuccinia psidii MF-1]|nr:hypothetical protein [Austropuccinia psidii MF-1]